MYRPQIGDIILEKSDNVGAKIVKFLMTAPTIWHWIIRAICRTQKDVQYFHVAMITSSDGEITEQQRTVATSTFDYNKRQIIFRRNNISHVDRYDLQNIAYSEIGQKYDILNCFGKTLTWLTGISLFAMYVQSPKKEICVCRVAHWYREALNEKFNCKTHSQITTQLMYEYLINNNYEIVYQKD